MWQQYRKTIFPTQAFIFGLTAVLYWRGGFTLWIVAVFFIVMQLGAVVGAAWASRLMRRIAKERDTLPLERLP